MIRRSFVLALVALLTAGITACDTVTDLGEVSLQGRWDSAGPLQALTGGVTLRFDPQSADGTFGGTWRVTTTEGTIIGAVVNGTNQDGAVQFTLQGFYGENAVFAGELTDRFRMAGDLTGFQMNGQTAVFRLSEI